MVQRSVFALLAASLLFLQLSCGGGSTPPPPPPPPPVTLSISPSGTVNVGAGQTRQFVANVTGTTNHAVTWQVNGITGGDINTTGSIDINGFFIAPQLVPSPANVTITAILQANTNKTASATVNVIVFVVISNPTSSLGIGNSYTFAANATGNADTSVDWSLSGPGTLTPNGSSADYSAPPDVPAPPSVTVIATSHADPTRSATDRFDIITDPFINQQTQPTPIALGTSGGNALDHTTQFCCSGTLGALVVRNNLFYILSNNHVLGRSGAAKAGESIVQPGLVDTGCFPNTGVATFTQAAPLQNGGVDAALAQVVSGEVDTTGAILQLGALSGGVPQPAPPSDSTTPAVGMPIAKSGRTSALTCGNVSSTSTTVRVAYSTSCGGATNKTITYNNQVVTSGSFAAAGDSGSLIVDSQTAQPVALLFAGDDATGSAIANPIQTVLAALKDAQNHAATIVGGPQHKVAGCANSNSIARGAAQQFVAAIPASEESRAADIKQRHEFELMQDPAVLGVGVGASPEAGRAAIVIYLQKDAPRPAIPSTIENLPTKIVTVGRFVASDWDPRAAQHCAVGTRSVSAAGARWRNPETQ